MRYLVVYSSRTGNTRRIAEAVYDILPEEKEIHSIESAPPPDDFDFIALGFWVKEGEPDDLARDYMARIVDKKVGVFGTLGAYPDSEHSRLCMERAKDLLRLNHFLGGFMCQGAVDPDVEDQVKEVLDEAPEEVGGPGQVDDDPVLAARQRPDERDLQNAQTAFTAMLRRI